MLIVESKDPGVHHCSFEVQDIDSIMGAHDYLADRGYRLDCGVGRHLLGSQIFDYWEDPWRRVHEHWTDTDVLNAQSPSALHPIEIGLSAQWGDAPPQDFVEHATP
jgi:hypothetical protein